MTFVKVFGTLFALWQIALLLRSRSDGDAAFVGDLVVYGASFTMFWWAARSVPPRTLALAFHGASPAVVIRTGPFKYVRHPFYTSYALYWLAGVVSTRSPWMLIPLVVMCAFYLIAARGEERTFLSSDLRLEYADYRRTTGAFLPRIRRR